MSEIWAKMNRISKRLLILVIIFAILSMLVDWRTMNRFIFEWLHRMKVTWKIPTADFTNVANAIYYSDKLSSTHATMSIGRFTFVPPRALLRSSPGTYRPLNNSKSGSRALVVLVWTTVFGKDWTSMFQAETFNGVLHECNYTVDKADLDNADYLLFHAADFGLNPVLPTRRRHDQKWVMWSMESPYNLGLGKVDYLRTIENVFNLTASYRWDADIFSPYGYCRPREEGERLTIPTSLDFAKNKTKILAWFSSNCDTPGRRELYVKGLKKYIDIDIFGDCGTRVCPKDQYYACKSVLNETYKFYLAFENSVCEDYITEKAHIHFSFDFNIVPVVLGGANYSRSMPPDSYIDVKNFTSPQNLAEYLKYLDRNDDVYYRYFRWRDEYRCGVGLPSTYVQMHTLRNEVSLRTTIGTDWSVERACQSPETYYENIRGVL